MLSTEELQSYVDWENGLISPHVFSSQAVYELELARVFSRSWLFLAHGSQIPKAGDFFATYMGADPILVVRQADGTVGAFLNACRHRGMKVCRADEGNAKAFTCTYHGWAYDTAGNLIDVPMLDFSYQGKLDMTKWGLHPVCRVATYRDFIFGSFDPSIADLDDYLGDMKYYMDTFLDTRQGGIEFYGGVQRARMVGNWKLAAEQFGGDTFHAMTSHVSDFAAVTPPDLVPVPTAARGGSPFADFRQFATVGGHGAGFGVGRFDRRLEALGAEPIIDEYQNAIEPELLERLGEERTRIFRSNVWHSNLFPNLSWLSNPAIIRVWHPKGPNAMEVNSWVVVDRDAPEEVKQEMRWVAQQHFGPQGLAEQDDGENFALIGSNLATRGHETHKLMLHYRMGLGEDELQSAQLGVQNGMGEMPQRLFYRRWLELMTDEST